MVPWVTMMTQFFTQEQLILYFKQTNKQTNNFSVTEMCFATCSGFGVNASTTPVERHVIAVVQGTIRGTGGLPRGSRAMSVKVSAGGAVLGSEAPPMIPIPPSLRTDAVFSPCS